MNGEINNDAIATTNEPVLMCKKVHIYKGPCTLTRGHAGGHVWSQPDETGPTTQQVLGEDEL